MQIHVPSAAPDLWSIERSFELRPPTSFHTMVWRQGGPSCLSKILQRIYVCNAVNELLMHRKSILNPATTSCSIHGASTISANLYTLSSTQHTRCIADHLNMFDGLESSVLPS